MTTQKTIFMPIYHGLQSAIMLQTAAIHELMADPALRVVVFCRPTKLEYYRNTFKGYYPRLLFEAVPVQQERTMTEKILKFIAANLLDTWDVYYLQSKRLLNNGKRFEYIAERGISKVFGGSRILRRLFRAADLRLTTSSVYDDYFDKYRPEAVFASDVLGLNANDSILLREAKRRGIKTVAMVRSWDNLTSKGVVRVQPDVLLVQTKRMADEAERLADMASSAIRTVGVPSFDHYFGYRPSPPEEFYKKAGLPVGKRFIFFSPLFEMYTDSTVAILKFLEEKIQSGVLPSDLAVLVRYPPSYTSRDLPEFAGSKVIYFVQPGQKFPDTKTRYDWEFNGDDKQHLADTIHYSAITVNFVSTVTIEAAVLGRPVINLCFETMPNAPVTKSLAMLYKQDHIRPLLAIGGFKLSRSYDDLVRDVRACLEHPDEEAARRGDLIREYVGELDGGAGKRVAGAIRDAVYTV